MLYHLHEMGWTRPTGDRYELVTIKGWRELGPKGGAGVHGRCFVAMSFDESLIAAYENGIKPGIMDCNL